MQKRIQYIDIARGISIFAIIFGHLGVWSINRVVFTFHVPIFFIITGYFMKIEPIVYFIKRKIRTLIVPYILTCIAMITLASIYSFLVGNQVRAVMSDFLYAALYGSGGSYTEPFTIKSIGAIWFLWATFWGSIILQLSLRLKAHVRMLWIAAWFTAGYITAHRLFWFPLSIQAGCCASLYMYIGYNVRVISTKWTKVPEQFRTVFYLTAFVAWAAFIYFFKSFWLVQCDFGHGVFDFFASLCACYCVMIISSWIEWHSIFIARIMSYFGRCSIIVLCVHKIELKLIDWWWLVAYFERNGCLGILSRLIMVVMKLSLIIVITIIMMKSTRIRSMFGIKV